jgi:hypothetical protein
MLATQSAHARRDGSLDHHPTATRLLIVVILATMATSRGVVPVKSSGGIDVCGTSE